MSEKTSFVERVRKTLIKCSKAYKKNFVDFEYLICSKAFEKKKYYIINAKEDNFQHLTGVHANVSPLDFFNKCYDGTLCETDFDFLKRGQSEKSVKGSVREKIKVLESAMELFSNNQIFVQEEFCKNKIICSFATSAKNFTLGFIDNVYSSPKSLLKNNQLKGDCCVVDLVVRKNKNEQKFSEVILGDKEKLNEYCEDIKHLLVDELIK